MATREITRAPGKGLDRATMIALVVAATSLIITIVVIVSIELTQPASRTGQPATTVTLGTHDDFALRHPAAAPALGPGDDYGLRHGDALPALGPLDDYALRH